MCEREGPKAEKGILVPDIFVAPQAEKNGFHVRERAQKGIPEIFVAPQAKKMGFARAREGTKW